MLSKTPYASSGLGLSSDMGSTPNTSKDVAWFNPDIADIDPAFRQLMDDYSKIPADSVKSHILAVVSTSRACVTVAESGLSQNLQREKAWHTFPFPCIGRFNFLALSITCHPCYPRVLSALSAPKTASTLLDLGCCFGQDIRKLVYDGAHADQLHACDLEYGFIDLGYELFADRDTLQAHFFAANLFDDNGRLEELEGEFDFIHIGSFLHLFSQEDQLRACKRIVKLARPQKGSTIFGRQLGNVNGLEVPNMLQEGTMWQHDPQTFKHMWQVVGEQTGTNWNVRVELDSEEGMNQQHWTSEGCRRLKFEVTRLS